MVCRMKHVKIVLIVLIIILTSNGCINRQSGDVDYGLFITPARESETILIVPLVLDNDTAEIANVMRVNPRFAEGNASLQIIETERGAALKITTDEYTEFWFSKKYYNISSDKLMANKTLSMTEFNYEEKGKPVIKSWVYVNSTTNNTSRIWITMSAGDGKARHLRISSRNISNGWHQIDVEEGISIAE
ncbi:MAG: hypothetical protein KAI72_06645 [Candidatus Pacebacteria bacterium]|nr:hypothetical protein [Candidatus Paceibacterota bacterium]